jgi:hypothetical protein
MSKTLTDGNGREHHRQTPCEQDAALYALDQFGNIAVARIVVTEGIGHTDDGAIEGILRISRGLYEGLAQEQRETGVTVAGQPLAQTANGVSFPSIIHAAILVHGAPGRYLAENSLAIFLERPRRQP